VNVTESVRYDVNVTEFVRYDVNVTEFVWIDVVRRERYRVPSGPT
jgi:hypothetical protein